MTPRHLLVHVDSSDRCAARLELAIDLARRVDATLTGLFDDPHVMTVAALDPAPGAGKPDGGEPLRAGHAATKMRYPYRRSDLLPMSPVAQ